MQVILDAKQFELSQIRAGVPRNSSALPPIVEEKLRISKPKNTAAGIVGVQKSFSIGLEQAGIKKTLQTMLSVNRFDGYDCPGCAWPDPDNHRSTFEFCENGAKAFATEATNKRLTPGNLMESSVTELSMMTDMELDKMGRITHPMYLREGSEYYEKIDWKDAFEIISSRIRNTNLSLIHI